MNYNSKDSVDKLKMAFKKQEVLNYPILKHPLKDFDFFIQDIYFTMVCILGNFNNNINEQQHQFLSRLLVGTNPDLEIIDYYRKSTQVDEKFLEQLINILKPLDLKYNLILDLILLLGLGEEKTEEQLELVSEIALILNCDLEKIKTISKITKGIIEQDRNQIIELTKINNNLLENYICYIREFYEGIISYNENLIYLYGNEEEKTNFKSLLSDKRISYDKEESFQSSLQINLEKNKEYKIKNSISLSSEKIIIKNYILELDDLQIIIKNCKEVELINCEFINLSTTPLIFNKCYTVNFNNCKFEKISKRLIDLIDCNNFIFKNCTIKNISAYRIINFNSLEKFEVKENIFETIKFKQLSEAMFSIDKWPEEFYISNNEFVNCKNTSSYGALLIFSLEKSNNYKVEIFNNKFRDCFADSIINWEFLKEEFYDNNFIDNIVNFKK